MDLSLITFAIGLVDQTKILKYLLFKTKDNL